MKTAEKQIFLKDGTPCILRSPNLDDGQAILNQLKTVFGETENLTRDSDEVTLTLAEERAYLEAHLAHELDFNMLAFVDGRIAGNLAVRAVNNYRKMRHRAGLGLTVLKEFWHMGVGSTLMKEGIAQARENGFEQIELDVFADNERAVALYQRYGFEEWGRIKRAGRFRDGSYHDELLMGLLL